MSKGVAKDMTKKDINKDDKMIKFDMKSAIGQDNCLSTELSEDLMKIE